MQRCTTPTTTWAPALDSKEDLTSVWASGHEVKSGILKLDSWPEVRAATADLCMLWFETVVVVSCVL